MNVTCPECNTIFRVDPAKVPPRGVRARCSVCGALIPVRRPGLGAPAAPPLAAAAAEPASPRGTPAAVGGAHPSPGHNDYPEPMAPRSPEPPPAPSQPLSAIPASPPRQPAPTPAPPPHREPDLVAPAPLVAEPSPAPAAFDEAPPYVAPAPAPEPPRHVEPEPPPAPGETTVIDRRGAVAPGRFNNPFLQQDPSTRARRLARALVSDLVVYYPEKRQRGLNEGNLKELFSEEIRKSWEEYTEQVGQELASTTPYFTEALNEILAEGRAIFS